MKFIFWNPESNKAISSGSKYFDCVNLVLFHNLFAFIIIYNWNTFTCMNAIFLNIMATKIFNSFD